jgi:hypothetical protein
MVRIEIKSAEYKIVNAVNDLILYTTELGDEVACSFFSLKLKKVALARNIDGNQLKQLINELNPNNLLDLGLIRVQLIGGEAGSTTSLEYLRQIIETLKIVDNNHNIINIISCDTSERLHPNSFEIDCYHGGIRNLALSF